MSAARLHVMCHQAASAAASTPAGATRRSQRVAVIGAGAAGLVAARELRAEGHSVTVLEQGSAVGGVWRYDPRIEAADPLGRDPQRARVHSSMYERLRTNLPRQIMGYLDFPFDVTFLGPRVARDPRSFCSHDEVLRYLEAFAVQFQLHSLIRFNERVLRVELQQQQQEAGPQRSMPGSGPAHAAIGTHEHEHAGSATSGQAPPAHAWLVTSERLERGGSGTDGGSDAQRREQQQQQQAVYDAVVVANGHYSEPNLPDLPGIDAFPGHQLHSHNYRAPHGYAGKVVLVVGASNSGDDICREISGVARKVLLSARTWKMETWASEPSPFGPGKNVYRVPMVTRLHADGSAEFGDAHPAEHGIDAIVYATGYRYTFPFLAGPAAQAFSVRDQNVYPLWLHMMPPSLAPSLALMGLSWKVVPFMQFELQAKLLARLLSGRAQLPSRAEMEADIAQHYDAMARNNVPIRYAHMQDVAQFAYNQRLVELCGGDVQPLPKWREEVYRAVGALKRVRPSDYKDALDMGQWADQIRQDFEAQVTALTGRPDGQLEQAEAEQQAEAQQQAAQACL